MLMDLQDYRIIYTLQVDSYVGHLSCNKDDSCAVTLVHAYFMHTVKKLCSFVISQERITSYNR